MGLKEAKPPTESYGLPITVHTAADIKAALQLRLWEGAELKLQ